MPIMNSFIIWSKSAIAFVQSFQKHYLKNKNKWYVCVYVRIQIWIIRFHYVSIFYFLAFKQILVIQIICQISMIIIIRFKFISSFSPIHRHTHGYLWSYVSSAIPVFGKWKPSQLQSYTKFENIHSWATKYSIFDSIKFQDLID